MKFESNVSNEVKSYQIFISDISWKKDTVGSYRVKFDKADELPRQFTLDVPANVLTQAEKPESVFNDVIESFAYNFLAHKFGHEVQHCQVFLPLD